MNDFNEYLREKKRNRDKAEINGYAKGMLASAAIVIVASLVSGAFSNNPLGMLLISVCAAFGSLPSYWLFCAIFSMQSDEPTWWHLPVSMVGMGVVGSMLGNIF
ncbi:MAG: hypothetical protein ACON4F_03180 [Candidatus Puniceispirillaceae bacterium]